MEKKFDIKMGRNTRIFILLLQKNFLVRKNLWIQSVIFQILAPIGLFLTLWFIWNDLSLEDKEIYTKHPGDTTDFVITEKRLRILNARNRLKTVRYTSRFDVANIPEDMMRMVAECLQMNSSSVIASTDEDKMVEELLEISKREIYFYGPESSMGIVFETAFHQPPSDIFKYKLRYRWTNNLLHNNISDLLFMPEILVNETLIGDRYLFLPSWLGVQICVDRSYIKWVTNSKFPATFSLQPMPHPAYHQIKYPFSRATSYLECSLLLMFIITLWIESGFPASEKQTGINILMAVNGARNYMNLLSWILNGAVFSLSYTIPIVIVLTFPIAPSAEPFFKQTNSFILWLTLFVLTIHFICFGNHLSAYFSKPSIGTIVKLLLMVTMFFIDFLTKDLDLRHFQLYFGIISPNFLLAGMIREFRAYEVQGGNIGCNMLKVCNFESPTEGFIVAIIVFSLVGAVFHFFMTVYINAISPGEYGVPRHLSFFSRRKNINAREDEIQLTSEKSNIPRERFETVPEGSFEIGLRIRRLTKTYTRGLFKKKQVHALRGVSADFYKGQITSLLGHNGAGKTTMMSILSGLTDTTEGVTFINGKNIQSEPDTIEDNVGLCLQKNIAFENLTVFQNLMFFGALKSRTKSTKQLEEEIENLLSNINLIDKKNCLPKKLSGGQKRRLCIAMAVIGDGNVIIFDEPTSGIDTENKRHIWDILLKMRGQKTIIISTHDMEEADVLSDRIAVMHTGMLRSYGTSMFLKKSYGGGEVKVTLSINSSCIPLKILQKINFTANILSTEEGRIILIFPETESLPAALDKLEKSKKTLGITGIGVSTITLSEIFTKITEDESESVDLNDADEIESYQKNTGASYFIQTFRGYSMKKKAYMMKNPWKSLINLFLPCSAIIFLIFAKSLSSSSLREYNLEVYSPTVALVKSEKLSLAEMFRQTVEDYGGQTIILKSGDIVKDRLVCLAEKFGVKNYKKKMIVSAEFKKNGTGIEALGFFSRTAIRGIPIAINCLTNTLLKDLSNNTKQKIEMSTEDFRDIKKEARDFDRLSQITITILSIMFLMPAIALYAHQPLEEAASGFKHLQCMTGASKISYWTSIYIFDIIQYIFSTVLLLLSFIMLDVFQGLHIFGKTEIGIFIALFLLFGMSVLPFIYLVSSFKLSQYMTNIILILLPSCLVIGSLFIWIEENHHSKNRVFNIICFIDKYVNLPIPHVRFVRGFFFFISVASINAMKTNHPSFIEASSYFEDQPGSKNLSLVSSMIELAALFFIYWFIIFLSELRIHSKIFAAIREKYKNLSIVETDRIIEIDEVTVRNEDDKYLDNIVEDDNGNAFSVHDLAKKYGELHVVKGVSFCVKHGECFGLLGVNGAGKSTIFRMLTGAEISGGGIIYIRNFGIHNNRKKYLAEIGYCPQNNILIDSLNSRDHLYLFARLRGVPELKINSVVEMWIRRMDLTACAAQSSGTYSGGKKRSLQIALALIGNPFAIVMDEPTAGLDPGARKSLWNIVKSCQSRGQSVIFSSHCMEECEVLCNRLAIMIEGQLVCAGAAQELKQRFGAGFNINIILSPNESSREMEQIKSKIETSLVCRKTDENSSFLSYHITDSQTTWTRMYATMESLKKDYISIEDYTVLSSTFEQLFIQFARRAKKKN